MKKNVVGIRSSTNEVKKEYVWKWKNSLGSTWREESENILFIKKFNVRFYSFLNKIKLKIRRVDKWETAFGSRIDNKRLQLTSITTETKIIVWFFFIKWSQDFHLRHCNDEVEMGFAAEVVASFLINSPL